MRSIYQSHSPSVALRLLALAVATTVLLARLPILYMGLTSYQGSHDARSYIVGRLPSELLPFPPISSVPWHRYDPTNLTHPFRDWNATLDPGQPRWTAPPRLRNGVTGEDWLPLWCSDDRYTMIEEVLPAGFVALAHAHGHSTETVTVTKGVIALSTGAGSTVAELHEGDIAHIPAGVSHALWALSADPYASMIVSYRHDASFASLRMCEFFEVVAALSADNLLVWPGIMDPLRAALIWRRFPDLGRFWWLPRWLQAVMEATLAPLADVLGVQLPDTPLTAATRGIGADT